MNGAFLGTIPIRMATFPRVVLDDAPPCLMAAKCPQICVTRNTTKAGPSEDNAHLMGNLGAIFFYMVRGGGTRGRPGHASLMNERCPSNIEMSPKGLMP